MFYVIASFYSKVRSVETGPIKNWSYLASSCSMRLISSAPSGCLHNQPSENRNRYRSNKPSFDRYSGNSGPETKQSTTIVRSGQTDSSQVAVT